MPSPLEVDRTINTRIMNDTTSDRMYNLSSNTDLDVKHHRFRSSLWELSLVILFVYKNICICGKWLIQVRLKAEVISRLDRLLVNMVESIW